MSLSDQVALVTGGGTGIGKAIAKAMLAEGAKVIIVGRKEEVLLKAQTELGSGCEIMVCDITEESQVNKVYETIMSNHGKLNILINNAGTAARGKAYEMSYEMWKKVTMENYHEMRDFKTSGLGEPAQWPNLVQVPKAVFEQAMQQNTGWIY